MQDGNYLPVKVENKEEIGLRRRTGARACVCVLLVPLYVFVRCRGARETKLLVGILRETYCLVAPEACITMAAALRVDKARAHCHKSSFFLDNKLRRRNPGTNCN